MKIFEWHDSEEEKKEIMSLTSKTYGDSEVADSSYYDWLYRNNPQGKPVIILATDEKNNHAIIGIEPIIPMKLIVDESVIMSFLSCNSAVNPDYRGKGIFSNLVSSMIDEAIKERFSSIYGVPNKNSYDIFKRQGFTEITRLPLLVRPLNLSHYFDSPLRSLLQPFDSIWKISSNNNTEIQLLRDEYSEDFDVLTVKASKRIQVIQKRDKVFLNWRYKNHPTRDYQTYVLKEDSILRGYIITREAVIKGKTIGIVVDFLVDSDTKNKEKLKDLVRAALGNFWKKSVSAVIATCRAGLLEYEILRKMGFFVVPEFLKPEPLYFIVMALDNSLILNKLKLFDNWFFSFGDYDVF